MVDTLAAKTEKLQHLQLRMMLAARLFTLESALRELTCLEDALATFAHHYFDAVGGYVTTLTQLHDTSQRSGLEDVGLLLHEQLTAQRSARKKRLKTSYRSLARTFHPDRHGNQDHAVTMMQVINTAYAACDVATLVRLEIEHLEISGTSAEQLAEKMARCEALIGACAAERAVLETSPMFVLHERTMLARLAGVDFIGRVVLGLKAQIDKERLKPHKAQVT